MVSLSFDSIYWLELLKIEMFAVGEYFMRGLGFLGARIICEYLIELCFTTSLSGIVPGRNYGICNIQAIYFSSFFFC